MNQTLASLIRLSELTWPDLQARDTTAGELQFEVFRVSIREKWDIRPQPI